MTSLVLEKKSSCERQSAWVHAKPWTKRSGGAPPPASTKGIRLLRFGLRLVRGGELLLELRRRRLVMAELHAVGAVPRRERFQPRREVLELGERRLRRDLDGSG